MNKKATAAIVALESTFRIFQKTRATAIDEMVTNQVAERLREVADAARGVKPAKRKPAAPKVSANSTPAPKPAKPAAKPRTTAPPSSPPKTPAAGTAAPATPSKRGRKPKMDATEVAGLADGALVLIAAAPAEGIGKAGIAATLGIETAQLRLPIASLIESGRITVTGAKRGTKYHAADMAATGPV